jgi:hypothetical protein
MFVTNTEEICGKTIVTCFGVVSGSTVRAKHLGRDIMAGLKNLVGGELVGYTELLSEARDQAMDRMKDQAMQCLRNIRVWHSSDGRVSLGLGAIHDDTALPISIFYCTWLCGGANIGNSTL